MKIIGIHNCKECKYFCDIATDYRVHCSLQNDSVRYKDYGTQNYHWDESVLELYQMCPLIDIDEVLSTPPKVLWEKLYNGD